MTFEEIKNTTQTIISELLQDVDESELFDDQDIFSLGMDSINAMTLVLNLQEAFGINFNFDEINHENFQTVRNIVDLVRGKLNHS